MILHQMWEMMIRDETPSISYKFFILSVSLGRSLLFRPNWYPLVWIFSGKEYGSLEIFICPCHPSLDLVWSITGQARQNTSGHHSQSQNLQRNLQQLALKISELWLVDSIPAQFFSKSIHQFKPPLFLSTYPLVL